MILSRRNFLSGLGAALAAPAIIRTPGLLMPIRALIKPPTFPIVWEEMPIFDDDFSTVNLIVKATERWSVALSDWRHVYGAAGV